MQSQIAWQRHKFLTINQGMSPQHQGMTRQYQSTVSSPGLGPISTAVLTKPSNSALYEKEMMTWFCLLLLRQMEETPFYIAGKRENPGRQPYRHVNTKLLSFAVLDDSLVEGSPVSMVCETDQTQPTDMELWWQGLLLCCAVVGKKWQWWWQCPVFVTLLPLI